MEKTSNCPKCNYVSTDEEFSVCPKCGIIIKKYYDTLATRQKLEAERLERKKKGKNIENNEPQKVKPVESENVTPKLINCPACQKEISFNADSCPKCGEPLTNKIRSDAVQKEVAKQQKEADKKRRLKKILFTIGALLFALYLLGKLLPNNYDSHNSPVEELPKTSLSSLEVGNFTFVKGETYHGDSIVKTLEKYGYVYHYSEHNPDIPNIGLIGFSYKGNYYTFWTYKENYGPYYKITAIYKSD